MSKKDAQTIIRLFEALPFDEQVNLAEKLTALADKALNRRFAELKAAMTRMDKVKKAQPPKVKQSRAKPVPTHRSKKDKSLTWSGRGSKPNWMVSEMKELKLKPDAFLIKQGR